MSDADDLDALMAVIDAELTRLYGPNHQEILGGSGRLYSYFDWETGETVVCDDGADVRAA